MKISPKEEYNRCYEPLNLILILDHCWNYFYQMFHNLCRTVVLEFPVMFVTVNWLFLVYENQTFHFLLCMFFYCPCFTIFDNKIYRRRGSFEISSFVYQIFYVLLESYWNLLIMLLVLYASKYMKRFLEKLIICVRTVNLSFWN